LPPSPSPPPPSPPSWPPIALNQALASSEGSLSSVLLVGGAAAVIFAAVLAMYVAFTRKKRGRGGSRGGGGRGRIDPTKQASSSMASSTAAPSSPSDDFHDFSIDKVPSPTYGGDLQPAPRFDPQTGRPLTAAADRGQQRAAEMELVSALVNAETNASPSKSLQSEPWMQSVHTFRADDQASFGTFGAEEAGGGSTFTPTADPEVTMCATFSEASARSPREQASRDKFRKRSQGSKQQVDASGPSSLEAHSPRSPQEVRAGSNSQSWFDTLGDTLSDTFRAPDASPERQERQEV